MTTEKKFVGGFLHAAFTILAVSILAGVGLRLGNQLLREFGESYLKDLLVIWINGAVVATAVVNFFFSGMLRNLRRYFLDALKGQDDWRRVAMTAEDDLQISESALASLAEQNSKWKDRAVKAERIAGINTGNPLFDTSSPIPSGKQIAPQSDADGFVGTVEEPFFVPLKDDGQDEAERIMELGGFHPNHPDENWGNVK